MSIETGMVIKLNNNSSLFATISYNQNKIEEGLGAIICTNKIDLFSEQSASKSIEKSFEKYLRKEPKAKDYVLHVSLNPAPGYEYDDYQLQSYAEFYLDKMGLKEQPYIVYKHTDIDRTHIHIVTLNTDENGRVLLHKEDSQRAYEKWKEKSFPISMPFGKHKGTLIKELPEEYVDWIRKGEKQTQIVKKILAVYDNAIPDSFEDGRKFGFKPISVMQNSRLRTQQIIKAMLVAFPELQKAKDELKEKQKIEKRRGENSALNNAPNPIIYANGDLKNQINTVLKFIHNTYNFTSIGEYNALLSRYNIQAVFVSKKKGDKDYNGIVYRVLEPQKKTGILGHPIFGSFFSDEETLEHSIAGSSIDRRNLSGEKVLNVFEEKKKEWKARTNNHFKSWRTKQLTEAKEKLEYSIFSALAHSHSEKDLRDNLSLLDIGYSLNRNKEGRIYGVTFVDHKSNIAINGSRLNKLLSANEINEWAANKGEMNLRYSRMLKETDAYIGSVNYIRGQIYHTIKGGDKTTDEAIETLKNKGVQIVKLEDNRWYYYDTRNRIFVETQEVNRQFNLYNFEEWQQHYIRIEREKEIAALGALSDREEIDGRAVVETIENALDSVLSPSRETIENEIAAHKDEALHRKFKRKK